MAGHKLSLKVAINKQKSKVLFAEADSDVVDVLLSFLTLPLGRIVRILKMHYGVEAPVIGSLTSLYRGLSNLDSSHFCVRGAKQMLLNPTYYNDGCRRLKLDISDCQPKKLYYHRDLTRVKSHALNASLYSDIAESEYGKSLNRVRCVLEAPVSDGDGDGEAFLIKSSPFIICDDLRVAPVMSGFLQTLNNLGITDTDGAELSTLSIDTNDIMDLLKLSLTSFTPLTDLVIKKTENSLTAAKPKAGVLLYHIPRGLTKYSRKMVLKVLLQKSTNKVLFAEASDEFVEFLFSLLCIRLGGVESLLGGMTCLKNVDNLYRSVRDVFDNKYFRLPDTKYRLMSSKLPHGYISKNQFLPLTEENPPNLNESGEKVLLKSNKGEGNFVKGQGSYIVTDDLTVTPFSITSSFSILNRLEIPLSDVMEKDFDIGVEEALCMLEASLTSTTVLTDVLINAAPAPPASNPPTHRRRLQLTHSPAPPPTHPLTGTASNPSTHRRRRLQLTHSPMQPPPTHPVTHSPTPLPPTLRCTAHVHHHTCAAATTNSEDGEVLGYPLVYCSPSSSSLPHQQKTRGFEQSEKYKTFWASILGCLWFLS